MNEAVDAMEAVEMAREVVEMEVAVEMAREVVEMELEGAEVVLGIV